MKSTLKTSRRNIPDKVYNLARTIISEWEVFTGGYDDFEIKGGFSASYQVSVVKTVIGRICPLLYIDQCGVLRECYNVDATTSGLYARCSVRDIEVGIAREDMTAPEINKILGVGDITNLQPHEYGILKIKYGWVRRDLFLPSCVIERYKSREGFTQ